MNPYDWTGRGRLAPGDLPFMMPRPGPTTEGERLALRLPPFAPPPRAGKREG